MFDAEADGGELKAAMHRPSGAGRMRTPVLTVAAGLYAASLPFYAVGTHRVRSALRMELWDAVLLVGLPSLAWHAVTVVRGRRWSSGDPLLCALGGLCVAALVSELRADAHAIYPFWLSVVPLLAAGTVAMAARLGALEQIVAWGVRGGTWALGLSLVAYLVALWPGSPPALDLFFFRSAHPVFDGVPRVTGTMGTHAAWLGEYAVGLVALCLVDRQQGRTLPLLLGGLTLLLSFSFAWFGGLVLLAAWLRRERGARGSARVLGVAAPVGAALAVGLMWLGVPGRLPASGASGAQLDPVHMLARCDGTHTRCEPVIQPRPFPHAMTHYALAAEIAAAAFRRDPLSGVGVGGYPPFAEAHVRAHLGPGLHAFYRAPVGLPAAVAAHTGILGLLALAGLLWALHGQRPGTRPEPRRYYLYWGVIALLLVSLQSDFELRGPLWLLLGLLAGLPDPAPATAAAGTT